MSDSTVKEEKASGYSEVIAELLRNGSIEFADSEKAITEVRDILQYGMSVYTPSLPGRTLDETLDRLSMIHEAGFDPVPHIAARRVKNRNELKSFLSRAVEEYGVHRVLLVGGDLDASQGPYNDAMHILKDGVLADTGVKEIGLGGYPEGHPRIEKKILDQALNDKIHFSLEQGLGVTVVTQFGFNPSRIVDYCGFLSREYPDILVYIGMAGPTNPAILMKYAKICGVSASLRALTDMGFKAAQLVSHPDPREQLEVLARYVAARDMPNVLGVHVFSFGGFVASVQWMNQYSYGLD